MNREAFLAERMTGIGGSDAAALFGLSPWATPIKVYNDKLGIGEDTPATERMEMGNRLEPVIADLYAEKTGRTLIYDPSLKRHPVHTFMIAHVDRFIEGNGKGLEIKTADGRFANQWGEAGSDDIPPYYNIQCQHYMSVCELVAMDLAVLIGGNEFRIYNIPRSDRIIQALIEKEGQFWNEHVVPQVPPEIDGSDASRQYIETAYQDKGTQLLADADTIELARQMYMAREAFAEAEETKKALENKVKAAMGDNSVFIGPGFKISFKQIKDSEKVDYKQLIADLNLDPGTLAKYTTVVPGYRRFTPGKLTDAS